MAGNYPAISRKSMQQASATRQRRIIGPNVEKLSVITSGTFPVR